MFYDVYQNLCKEKGKSATGVAIELNIARSTVANWKKTGTTPQAEILQKLADYFGVSVDYLLNEETKKSPAEAEDKITFDDFTYAMYNHSADLTEEEKKMLLEMAEFMKKKRGL